MRKAVDVCACIPGRDPGPGEAKKILRLHIQHPNPERKPDHKRRKKNTEGKTSYKKGFVQPPTDSHE